MIDLSPASGALISDCELYRYLLWRRDRWRRDLPLLGFVMLNPSTADANADDPTIRRCKGFAESLGFGGILVGNVFAWRATNPKDLPRSTDEAFGPLNADALAFVASSCPIVIAAWGAHARAGDLAQRIRGIVGNLQCLDVTKDGAPRHPLYLRSDLRPQTWPLERP